MIILASGSASRRAMLEAAGVAFTAIPPALDERALESALAGAAPAEIALALAQAKALAVDADDRRDALVLGSDSLVVVDGQRFDKPVSRQAAEEHLCRFSGRVMELHSAAALVRGGDLVWGHTALARLHVRPLTDAFINHYLDREWPAIGGCVGAFRIEGPGVQLFDAVEGDHFTILGMPLLPVLGALRDQGVLPA